MSQSAFESQLASFIVESLNLQHVSAADINRNTRIIGSDLELDSVDILEVVVALEKKYGVQIRSDDEGRKIFENFGTLSDYVYSNAPSQSPN